MSDKLAGTHFSWIFVLLGSLSVTVAAFFYIQHVDREFKQEEVALRSELLLSDLTDLIGDGMEMEQALSVYLAQWLAPETHDAQLLQLKELLSALARSHSHAAARVSVIFPDTTISHGHMKEAPLLSWSDWDQALPSQEMMPLFHITYTEKKTILQLVRRICTKTSNPCAFAVVTFDPERSIGAFLARRATSAYAFAALDFRFGLRTATGEATLFQHGDIHNQHAWSWKQAIMLGEQTFFLQTAAHPSLLAHLSSHIGWWIFGLGTVISGLLSLLTFHLSRYASLLEHNVAKRTQQLQQEKKKLGMLVEHALDGILLVSVDGRIVMSNPAARKMFGYDEKAWRSLRVGDLVPGQWRRKVRQWIEYTIRHGGNILGKPIERMAQHKNGTVFPCELTLLRSISDEGRYLIIFLRDLSERKHYEERLQRLYYFDELTGLPNRRLFIERLEYAIASTKRRVRPLAVLHLGLDRFKLINDTLGHETADLILQAVANTLTTALREGDIVARLDNDEFGILLHDIDADTALETATRIRVAIQQAEQATSRQVKVRASIGIAVFPDDAMDAESLLRSADLAMYNAKECGKRICYFAQDMEQRIAEKLSLEQELSRAIEQGELRLYYQSQHQIGLARDHHPLTGCETMLRWEHPEKGLLSPDKFIPLAEESGLIEPLTEWMIREACRRCSGWEREGIRPPHVGINLSASQLTRNDLAGYLVSLIEQEQAYPSWFTIEITETTAMHDAAQAVMIMQQLVRAGFSIAIDDFGTGYSSLAYLKRLPAAWLKVDKMFVQDLPYGTESSAIVHSTIAMAHAMGMHVIAEGVETKAQLAFLKRYACDAVQGYLFSTPMPADAFSDFLQQQQRRSR